MITNKVIADLNPCSNRHENYLNFYKNKSYSKRQFMGLKNITHEDKLWVVFRLLSKENIQLAAADIAESVLHIFESKYPNDNRPRLAIEAARNTKMNSQEKVDAARCAADAAYAANTARCAADAAYAAANAAYAWSAADAAYAAANAAYAWSAANASNKLKQEKLIRTILLKYWKESK